MKPHDLTGRSFGKLVAVRMTSSTRSGMTRWLCNCACGSATIVATKHLLKGTTKSCGKCSVKRGPDHPSWKGVGELSGDAWYAIRYHSMERTAVPVTITHADAWELFKTQGGKCALSGLGIYFGNGHKRTASLDRIDSSLGYVPGNVQWVHKDVNKMKNTYVQAYFVDLCKLIAAKAVL